MPHAELDRLEGDVRDARRRLKSDLEVLRAPETFSSFKEEVLGEVRQSRDDIVANVKEAAADRAERLVADIKERAAANPVAVGAIAAGVAWRIPQETSHYDHASRLRTDQPVADEARPTGAGRGDGLPGGGYGYRGERASPAMGLRSR
jgi:hypothetical protein